MSRRLLWLAALACSSALAQPAAPLDISSWTPDDWRLMDRVVRDTAGPFAYQYLEAEFSSQEAAERAVQVGALNARTAPGLRERRARYLLDIEPALRPWVARLARQGDITLPIARTRAGGERYWTVLQLRQRSERGLTPMGNDLPREVKRWVERGLLPSPRDLPALAEPQASMVWGARLGGPNSAQAIADVPADVPANVSAGNGNTPLTVAIAIGKLDAAEALVRRGADPNRCGALGCPLMVAVDTTDPERALRGVERLLALGAKPDQRDQRVRDEFLTPLVMAAYRGHRHAAEALLAAGAQLDAYAEARHTPIEAAASGGHFELVQRLAERGARLLPRPPWAAGARPGGVYDAAGGERAAEIRAWAERQMLQAAHQDPAFSVEVRVEQDGKAVRPSASGEWALAPRAFQLVFRFPGSAGDVMVAGSLDANWLAQLQGRDLRNPVFRAFASGGLADADRSKPDTADLLIQQACDPAQPRCEGGYNVFSQDPSDRQDFHERRAGPAPALVRDVSRLLDTSAEPIGEPVPLTQLAGRTLYLAVGVPLNLGGPEGDSQRLPQQQLLRLKFAEPKAAVPVQGAKKR